jgi:thioredoxin 1
MSKPIDVSDQSFEKEVLKSETPVLVDFWAEWCGPCKMIGPIVEDLSDEFGSRMKFAKLDVDANPNTASTYGVRSIPTLLVFRSGNPVDQVIGAVPKSVLKKKLDAILGES